MSIKMVLAAVIVPIFCGLAATYIVTLVQRGVNRHRDTAQTRSDDESDL